MSKKNRNEDKSLLHFLEGFTIVLLLCMIVIFVLYSINPSKVKETMNMLAQKIQLATENIQETFGEKQIKEDNLVFPEKEDLTGAQRYYYYQQLSQTGKKIYITIENNMEALKNGEDNIPLPPSLDEDAKQNGKEYIAKEFQNAWDAFVTDRSEYFYIDSSKVCLVTKMITRASNVNYEFYISKGQNENYFTKDFNSKADVEKAVAEVESIKAEVLQGATGSNYEKIKYIHNWIVDNVKYDATASDNISNIYGCLVNRKVVCEGYARAFKYLLDELDIPVVLVSGIAVGDDGKSERHAWNYVYINNNWYAIDTTWDDPIIIGNGRVDEKIKYKYFLKGSQTMSTDHTTIGQITKNGFEFEYPELSMEDIL
ncbi:MAG: hypothetical protein IKD76_03295 [Clostridia bacterium]|nr:hypothetical protein [Clostridia bacterium]